MRLTNVGLMNVNETQVASEPKPGRNFILGPWIVTDQAPNPGVEVGYGQFVNLVTQRQWVILIRHRFFSKSTILYLVS